MVPVIILLLSIIIDGVLTNFLPYLVNNLSYFTPLFTVTSIFLIYPFYRKNKRLYFITLFITGFIYDLFYTNLLFYNGVLFVIIGLITYLLYKNFEVNFFKLIIRLSPLFLFQATHKAQVPALQCLQGNPLPAPALCRHTSPDGWTGTRRSGRTRRF